MRAWADALVFLGIVGLLACAFLAFRVTDEDGDLTFFSAVWFLTGAGLLLNGAFWASVCRALESLLEGEGRVGP